MRTGRAAAPLLLAVLVLGACAGEDRLSRAELVERANAACRETNRRIEAIPAPERTADVPRYVDRATAELDRGIAALRDLAPPEEMAGDYARFLRLSERTRSIAGDLRRAARASDEQGMQAASDRGDVVDRESDAVARRMGIAGCAES